MLRAPEHPTTQDLHTEYGLLFDAAQNVQNERAALVDLIENHETALIAIIGVCAALNTPQETLRESDRLATGLQHLDGMHVLNRNPFWKPRSRSEDWHGLETTEPEAAYRITNALAERHGNVAAEISNSEQIARYGAALTLGWTGGRNADRHGLLAELATADPTLPLAVKNALNGNVDELLVTTNHVSTVRGSYGAPVVPLYRGGTEANTPSKWRNAYMRALDQTQGKLIVDVAHGSEMAFDPEQNFGKTVTGQIHAMEMVIQLAEQGYMPLGIMIEASDLKSPTDPVMPLDIAIAGCHALYAAKTRQLVAA